MTDLPISKSDHEGFFRQLARAHWMIFTTAVALFTFTYALAADTGEASHQEVALTATVVVNPACAELVNRTVETYRSLKTYQDRMLTAFVLSHRSDNGDVPFQEQSYESTFAYMAPNCIKLHGDGGHLICNGMLLWNYNPELNQYTISEECGRGHLVTSVTKQDLVGNAALHPIARLLLNDGIAIQEIFPEILKIESIVSQALNGRSGHRLFGHLKFENIQGEFSSPFSFWIDSETALLHEVRVDVTDAYRGLIDVGQSEVESDIQLPSIRIEIVLSLSHIVADGLIPANHFIFVPMEADAEVSEFVYASVYEAAQLEMIGKPAPELTGRTLDGAVFSLAALRGNVVLLDFWATWCGACMDVLPHIQKVAEKYKDKPVVVVGVNQDAVGMERQVKGILKKMDVTVTQFMDPDREAGKAYHVSGIPCIVLVDAQGIICDIDSGFGATGEDDVAGKIDSVLDGRTIHDAEALAKRLKELKGYLAEASRNDKRAGAKYSANLENYESERLIKGDAIHVASIGTLARRFDVEGSSELELVIPDTRGGLTIVSSDGRTNRRIQLQGLGRDASFQVVEPVRCSTSSSELYWLVVMSKYQAVEMATRDEVVLYDEMGSQVWSFVLELPRRTSSSISVAVGDLISDSSPEVVAAFHTYDMHSEAFGSLRQESQGSYLVVLDLHGKRLCQERLTGQVNGVTVVPWSEKGGQGTIFCSCANSVERYYFKSNQVSPVK